MLNLCSVQLLQFQIQTGSKSDQNTHTAFPCHHAFHSPVCVSLHLSHRVCVCLKSKVLHCVWRRTRPPVNRSCSSDSGLAHSYTPNPNTYLAVHQPQH